MLDAMWKTFSSMENADQEWFDYSVRGVLGEPTLVGKPIRDHGGLGGKVGRATYWRYDQYRNTKRTFLGKLRYGWF